MSTPERPWNGSRADPIESALAAFAVALLCTLLVDVVEHAEGLRYVRKVTWDWLATRLASEAGEVVVVDITSIARPSNALGRPVTDRGELRAVIELVRQAGPRAIGIDIDLAPEGRGPVDEHDPELLEWLAGLQDDGGRPIPVRVGVHRTRMAASHEWLGDPDFDHLAATMVADTSDNRLMPEWAEWREGVRLAALGAATATDCMAARCMPPARWPSGLAQPFREHWAGAVRLHSFFVDFSTLPDLIDRRLPAAARDARLEPGALRERLEDELSRDPSLVAGKVVFIGFADPRSMLDNGFVVPGSLRAVPGTYAHAAAAATLLGCGYLYAPTVLLEKLLDVGLALTLILLVTLVRRKLQRGLGEEAEGSLHLLLTAGVILATWLWLGPALVRWLRVVPDGLPIVTLALLAEILWDPLLALSRAVRVTFRQRPTV